MNSSHIDHLNSPYCSYIIALLLMVLTFISCDTDKCPSKDNIYYKYLTVDEKRKIPYSGYDTLYFLDEKNNEIVLLGRGKKVSYYDNTGIILDCTARNIDRHEINQFNFDSSNNTVFIEMKEKQDYFNIKVNGLSSQAFIDEISNSEYRTFKSLYQIDSITFNNVNILSGIENQNQLIVLNKELGIIQVKFSDTHYWLIKNH